MQFTTSDQVYLIQSARAGNEDAMEALLAHYDELIHAVARRYAGLTAHREQNFPDFLQDARLAFMRAVHAFDPARVTGGGTLRAYAGRSMENECKDQSRFYLYPYTIPQRSNDQRLKLHRIERELQAHLGREPLTEEIAAAAELSTEEVERGMTLPSLVFLDHPPRGMRIGMRGMGSFEDDGVTHIPVSDAGPIGVLLWRALLVPCVALLPEQERTIIQQAVMEGMSQREIAQAMNLSELSVSRLKQRALKALRDMIGSEAVLS